MSRKDPRDPAGATQMERAAQDRAFAAAADGNMNGTDWRVFTALCRLVTSYQRVQDYVANKQVAELSRVEPREVRRSLLKLHRLGIIRRVPGSSLPGRSRQASLISFDPQMVLVDTPVENAPTYGRGGTSPGVRRVLDRGGRRPTSEDLSEGNTAWNRQQDAEWRARQAEEPSREEAVACAKAALPEARAKLKVVR